MTSWYPKKQCIQPGCSPTLNRRKKKRDIIYYWDKHPATLPIRPLVHWPNVVVDERLLDKLAILLPRPHNSDLPDVPPLAIDVLETPCLRRNPLLLLVDGASNNHLLVKSILSPAFEEMRVVLDLLIVKGRALGLGHDGAENVVSVFASAAKV